MKVSSASVVLLVLLVVVGVDISAQDKPDLTGTWVGVSLVPNVGEDPITLELKREGDAYSGTCADGAGMIVEREIRNVAFKEGTLTFDIGVSNGTDVFPVHLSLKVEGDKMAGNWSTDQGESGEVRLARKIG